MKTWYSPDCSIYPLSRELLAWGRSWGVRKAALSAHTPPALASARGEGATVQGGWPGSSLELLPLLAPNKMAWHQVT